MSGQGWSDPQAAFVVKDRVVGDPADRAKNFSTFSLGQSSSVWPPACGACSWRVSSIRVGLLAVLAAAWSM